MNSRFLYVVMMTIPQEDYQHALRLPTELLIAIVDQVEEDEDLLSLAAASRQFHILSLNRYFSRHNFDPYSKEIEIHPHTAPRNVLGGLAISLGLVGTSLDYLSYDCGVVHSRDPEKMTKEVCLLTKYISKLSSVKRASLRLTFENVGLVNRRQDVCLIFLNTILKKRCKDIRVIASHFASVEPKDMPRHSEPSSWLKDYWPAHHSPPKKQHVERCYIQSFPRFLRPFYFYTLGTNSSYITDLSFKNIFGGGTDWASVLSPLHFPHLRRFALTYAVIPRDPFIKFLSRHPDTLTEFHYDHIRYEPRPKKPPRKATLEPVFQTSLETLTTSPEHINNFLPSFASMSRVTCVTINIDEHGSDFVVLEASLKHLATCGTKITLMLAVAGTGLGFGAWFTRIFASRVAFSASARPECKLHCVQTLIIDNGDHWDFRDDVISWLPRWITLFPELRALTLRGRRQSFQYLPLDDDTPADFTSVLKEACPGLYVEYIVREASRQPYTFV